MLSTPLRDRLTGLAGVMEIGGTVYLLLIGIREGFLMYHKKLTFLAVSVALAVLASACATSQPTGFLGTYENLSGGHHIEKVWYDHSQVRAGQYGSVELGRIDTTRIHDRGGVTLNECVAWMRSSLVQFESSDRILSLSGSGSPARLDLAITEMNPGGAFMRMMIAELGAGHAWVQVEGRVVDPSTNTVLVTFSDRRRGSGVIGFRDLGGDAGPAMVREMLESIAGDVKQELQEIFALDE
jgi:hypothetical protein